MKQVPTVGTHFLFELREKDIKLADYKELINFFADALTAANANIVDFKVVEFPNGASSGIFVLAESHLSWHSWPEEKYMSLDVYTCGNSFSIETFSKKVEEKFFIDYFKGFMRGIRRRGVFKIREIKL